MTCALPLDGGDDGERCTLLDTWIGYACVDSNNPHMQARACGVRY